ncbi:hypothetical protein M595_2192 [Lyngbya aestuarii BL J]|uniref:Apea-like HEPN domain-containing protein n=1 Tax=Lyngbya aestuarii BL J TaxID=1348334 RepID=U7QIR8_9CYAN|nr:hypothetical protein [Lyngbya aestuarii]ERT07788.1 hypothetical protein M595_2192 [Lyngbya aestuarii BL J]
MNSLKKKRFADYGPYSHWNWQAQSENSLPHCAVEIELFSDACFIRSKEVEHGPYLVIDAEPFPPIEPRQSMHGRLILRCEYYLDPNQDPTISPRNTDTSRYHGGSLQDEIAAIYSLCLGVRLKAGGIVRQFSHGNEYGRPRIPRLDETPIFFTPRNGRYILPWHPIERKLDGMQEQINSYILLTPQQASILVRAARLYQDAVWLAESDPEISWLLLVSAVEVAADYWYAESNPDPIKQLEQLKPDLFQKLKDLENDGLQAIEIVSKNLEGLFGSTKKFRQFLCKFKPHKPPANRPICYQVDWSQSSLDKIFSKVYTYRSKALHGGTPFPKPMCRPPTIDHQNQMFAECPDVGLAEASLGASWKAKDVPIHLHIFEYIVRHSLLNWWQSMIEIS